MGQSPPPRNLDAGSCRIVHTIVNSRNSRDKDGNNKDVSSS